MNFYARFAGAALATSLACAIPFNPAFVEACTPPAFNPAYPGSFGYTLVFNGTFEPSGINTSNTPTSGYKWYLKGCCGYSSVSYSSGFPTTGEITVDANNVLTINPPSGSPSNYAISSVGFPDAGGWVGTAFSNGWYVETMISFDASISTTGWPAFWANDVNVDVPGGLPLWWGDSAGSTYDRHIENDMFEYDTAWAGHDTYGATLHDWFGSRISPVTTDCGGWHNDGGGICHAENEPGDVVHVGTAVNWSNFNKISQLYVPGTSANGYHGYVKNYLNNVLMSTVPWTGSATFPSPPPPGNGVWDSSGGTSVFMDMDKTTGTGGQARLDIILGTGVAQPMKVQWVHVWQLSTGIKIVQ